MQNSTACDEYLVSESFSTQLELVVSQRDMAIICKELENPRLPNLKLVEAVSKYRENSCEF